MPGTIAGSAPAGSSGRSHLTAPQWQPPEWVVSSPSWGLAPTSGMAECIDVECFLYCSATALGPCQLRERRHPVVCADSLRNFGARLSPTAVNCLICCERKPTSRHAVGRATGDTDLRRQAKSTCQTGHMAVLPVGCQMLVSSAHWAGEHVSLAGGYVSRAAGFCAHSHVSELTLGGCPVQPPAQVSSDALHATCRVKLPLTGGLPPRSTRQGELAGRARQSTAGWPPRFSYQGAPRTGGPMPTWGPGRSSQSSESPAAGPPPQVVQLPGSWPNSTQTWKAACNV